MPLSAKRCPPLAHLTGLQPQLSRDLGVDNSIIDVGNSINLVFRVMDGSWRSGPDHLGGFRVDQRLVEPGDRLPDPVGAVVAKQLGRVKLLLGPSECSFLSCLFRDSRGRSDGPSFRPSGTTSGDVSGISLHISVTGLLLGPLTAEIWLLLTFDIAVQQEYRLRDTGYPCDSGRRTGGFQSAELTCPVASRKVRRIVR
jgi:hypothetical protein